MSADHQPSRLKQIAPLVVLLGLAAGQLLSSVINDCIDFESEVEVGETVELSVDEATWLRADTSWGPLYRVEVNGTDGAALELWSVYYDSGSDWCWYLDEEIHNMEIDSGSASYDWLGDGSVAIQLIPAQTAVGETFTLSIEELATPPSSRMRVIPAVAHVSGVGSTFFRTDVWIFNPSVTAATIDLVLVPSDGGIELSSSLSVGANRTVVLEDVVDSVFGMSETTGMLRLNHSYSSNDPVIASRTFNTSDTGTFGQFIPAMGWREAAGIDLWSIEVDRTHHLLHLAGPGAFRTNIGFAEVFGIDAALQVDFVDSSGTVVGGGPLTVPASSHLQINDVYNHFGLPSGEDLSASVSVLSFGRVFAYASVIDNLSSDPIYLPGLSETDAETQLVIPAAAATSGSYGSRWRTDLRVLSLSGGDSVQISFIPTDGSEVVSAGFDFEGSGMLSLDDVVSQLGATGSGALLLEATHDMVATSRTFNANTNGTFGQLIPAEASYRRLRSGTAIGARRSEHYRTNVGMVWPFLSDPFEMIVRLVAGDGRILGSDRWTIEGPQHVQINDVFAALRVPWQAGCRVDFEAADQSPQASLGVSAYASIIDNASGDAVYVPAELNENLSYHLELDNRANAVLIDQLPEAVGLDVLPSGTLTATVSGEGNLGGPSQPIHVLCLYKTSNGALHSAAVPIGGSIEHIKGGERLWCVIPDWQGSGSNSGAVTVTISGGDQPAELQLDAQANVVFFDQLQQSVVVEAPPHEALQVNSSGNFGAEYLAPQLMMIFNQQGDSTLQVRALSHGQEADEINTTAKLLMVLVDWIRSDDNTGTTRLEPTCTSREVSCNGSVTGGLSRHDCETGPIDIYHWAERVTFDGISGQVVTIVADWGAVWGRLLIDDPAGDFLAMSSTSWDQFESRIDDLSLPDTGTYSIWVATSQSYVEVPYSLSLSCVDP